MLRRPGRTAAGSGVPGAARDHPDRDAPVLLVQVAGRALAVRRRRRTPPGPRRAAPRRRRAGSMRSVRVRSVPRPSPSREQRGRRRGDDQLRRRPEAVVDLLARRRREVDHELEPAAGDLGDGPLGAVREALDLDDPGERDPGEPVRGRLDDHEVVARRRRRRSAPRDRSRASTSACRRVVAAYGAVVGVADGDRPVGQRRDAERVLQQRGRRARRPGSRSRTARCRPPCGPAPSSTPAQRTTSRCPPARAGRRGGASPEVCANQASGERAVEQPLVAGAAARPRPRRSRGSNVHSWWMPAIATHTRSCHQATSQGLDSDGRAADRPASTAGRRRPAW